MREIIVGQNEAGQRLDKLLKKYLKEAPGSFIYKMLRKKNIVLNDKKADGTEQLALHDTVRMYFSEETFEKMTGRPAGSAAVREQKTSASASAGKAVPLKAAKTGAGNAAQPKSVQAIGKKSAVAFADEKQLEALRRCIVYEDENLLLLNKAAGWLSQSDGSATVSVNELCLAYLMQSGQLTEAQLATFKPGIANRLDRNTSGLLLFGKTLPALQQLAQLLKDRTLSKYYLCAVQGVVREKTTVHGYLVKDEKRNRVSVTQEAASAAAEIHTAYEPLRHNGQASCLRVHLITGKTHQIRAHLASCGHPLFGDAKYGNAALNKRLTRQYGLNSQLLHAEALVFPEALDGALSYLAGRKFTAPLPARFEKLLTAEGLLPEIID